MCIMNLILLVTNVNSLQISFVPERAVVDYVNEKYVNYFGVSVSRRSRGSPYSVTTAFHTTITLGDNIAFTGVALEHLSSGYQPTMMRIGGTLCHYFSHDPYFGIMYSKQFGSNVSCPFQKNYNHSITVEMNPLNIRFNIPFTFSSKWVQCAFDMKVYQVNTKEPLVLYKLFVTVVTDTARANKTTPKKSNTKTRAAT